MDELVAYDDLFFLCFIPRTRLGPASFGKLCTAHIITLHGDTIYDTAKSASLGGVCKAEYSRLRGRPRESWSSRSIIGCADEHGSQQKAPQGFSGCVAYGPPFGIGLPVDPPEGRPLVIVHPAAAMHHASFGLVSDGSPFIHVVVDAGEYTPVGISANEEDGTR